MSGSTTNDADRTERQHGTLPLVARARDSLARLGPTRRGTIAMLAGGALIARAKSARGTFRTAISALAGLGLVAYGVRQRLSGGRGGDDGSGGPGPRDRPDDRTGATDEGAGATESMRQESHTGTNPRDVDDEPDVETETGPDEGRVRFTTDHDEPGATAPDLEEAGERDPRLDDETDDETDDADEVDISEAAMADEPNEATGPTSEQAFPSQVEDTEPDPSPAADTSHVEADEPTTDEGEGSGTESGEPSDEAGGTEGATGSETDAVGEDGEDGEEVSTEDRYEGERGEDSTVEAEDDGAKASDERDGGAEASDERDGDDETE